MEVSGRLHVLATLPPGKVTLQRMSELQSILCGICGQLSDPGTHFSSFSCQSSFHRCCIFINAPEVCDEPD